MLEVGNGGLTPAENRAHFSMWCMLAAPLISGNDLRKMSKETAGVLTNRDVIAVDQDSLGLQAFQYAVRDSVEIWFKPLSNNNWAVCFLNRSVNSRQVDFNWKKEMVSDEFSGRQLDAAKIDYTIKNLWTKREMGTTADGLSLIVAPHDILMLGLTKPGVRHEE
jgi:alpha-galactosidase